MSSLTHKPQKSAYLTDDQRWKAVVGRDKQADNLFFYAVRTTGVYCLPSCSVRKPHRENISFYSSSREAEQAGFRACKRCQPNGPNLASEYLQTVTHACRLIETEEIPPTLNVLARKVGMSPYHFHRIFTQIVGITPKAYATAHRTRKVRKGLTRNSQITETIYDSGYNSNGRFYAKSTEMLGMLPQEFKKGGPGTEIRFAVGECSLGSILVAASDKGICAISLGNDPDQLTRDLQDQFPKARLIGGDPSFEQKISRVVGFVENPQTGLDLPLDIRGTAFQQRVWQALSEIPVGSTVSYTELAQRIGKPRAVRAVAGACAANKLAVAIPCHRVVRTNGDLSGYRWGIERKRALIKREAPKQ